MQDSPWSPDRLINAFDLRAFQLWLSEDLLYVTEFKAGLGWSWLSLRQYIRRSLETLTIHLSMVRVETAFALMVYVSEPSPAR